MHDLYNNVKVVRAIDPAAVGTTGIANGKLSPIIDFKGFKSKLFAISYGTTASAADTVTPVIYEADATNGTFTSVADTDLIGTEAAAALPAAARTTGVGANIATKVGYKGSKRYGRIRIYGVGTATCIVSAQCLLSNPNHAPVA